MIKEEPLIKLSISDISGKIIQDYLFESTNKIDLDILGENGVYFISIENGEKKKTTIKVIKQ